ncbi:hypothetical protein [Enterovibrio paralichthyis]|uniref:hypothetical protein n=1 Tax=Enterovibrio paralichthyis TaxID=2853805 RepID=UPI001C4571B7|nr:hypothetical protein [Enterovibrio paralichthyis]MBV7296774.1 hypothetical protein [Enterovibrio paralichthyis]
MAAEKLTTARLVQILVVLILLIAAFTWRTFNYSNTQNKDQCSLNSGACSVGISGGTVEIKLFNQEDGGVVLRVNSPEKPVSLTSIFPKTNIDITESMDNENGVLNAYVYTLPDDVEISQTQKLLLVIDQDQIEINF